MTFAGLPLTTLLTIAGAAGAAVVLLYILKLRRRPVPVVFARIWDRVLRDKQATNLFSQLKRILSLLLQLLLLALLIFALGDPRWGGGERSEGRNLVVLVDASASMKAIDVEPSRLELAKRELRDLVKGLGGSDRMLIAQMDMAITPLSTMTNEIADLNAAIDGLTASDTRADLRRGLELALDSLRDLPKKEIVVVSDGQLGDVKRASANLDLSGVELSYVPVGKSAKNVAITQFSVRRYPLDKSRYEVLLELTNTNDKPAQVELSLFGDGKLVDVTQLSLGPNERLPRFYQDLAGANRTLEAEIRLADGAKDDLPADDHVYALMPERRRARVLVVTEGNTYLEAALLLDEYLDVRIIEPGEYPPKESFDVTLFDNVAPPPVERAGARLYLNPPEDGSPVPLGKPIEMFGFDTWDKKSPILRWMAMGDIQVAAGHAFRPRPEDHVVGASLLGPILVSGTSGGTPYVALSFDPRRSDFVLRIGWPLFILNTVNTFVEEDTNYLSSYRTGEVWRIPAPAQADVATLIEPDGSERTIPVQHGKAVYLGQHAGFYELKVAGGRETSSMKFAANLSDLEESRIEPVKELALEGKPAGTLAGFGVGVRQEIWLYLLAAAIVLSLIEWWTYHRRVTV